ncbi:MAG: hypothetical protein GXP40_02210 [Chloroflexi bacterium]|nr:hypothetical protein [Chloroflexota bacterium]
MLTDSALRELLEYVSPDPVLSVYLNTDLSEGNVDVYKLNLRTLLKEVDLPEDTAAVLQYFEHERDRSRRSIAMFSCAAQDFFRAYPLAVPVHSRVHVANRPYFKPLAHLLDAYGSYGVVLVDKQGARLFLFHLGELIEQEGVLGEDVRHTKRGNASSVRGRRGGASGQTHSSKTVAERNIKDAADFAVRFFEENHVRRILIGGTESNTAKFRSLLPKTWQSLIVGTLPMSITSNPKDILERATKIGSEAEQKREARLVTQMVTAAAKGGEGVVRLDDTLTAVREGRVQTLIVHDEFHASGYRCEGCGYITTQKPKTCPFCGKGFTQIPDAVEMAVRQAMQAGSEVEVVRDNETMKEIGIGGLLRY